MKKIAQFAGIVLVVFVSIVLFEVLFDMMKKFLPYPLYMTIIALSFVSILVYWYKRYSEWADENKSDDDDEYYEEGETIVGTVTAVREIKATVTNDDGEVVKDKNLRSITVTPNDDYDDIEVPLKEGDEKPELGSTAFITVVDDEFVITDIHKPAITL